VGNGICTSVLFVWLISHHPAVLFSQNKPVASNQPAILFSQNKSALAISHQPNEQAEGRFCPSTARLRGSGAVAFWAFFCCLSKFLGAYLSNNFFSCNYNSLEAKITADRAQQQQQPLATFFNLLVWCRFSCRSRVTAHVKAARVAICYRRASLHTMPRPTGPLPLCAVAAAPEARARWPL
jgi:hypothetical protein